MVVGKEECLETQEGIVGRSIGGLGCGLVLQETGMWSEAVARGSIGSHLVAVCGW